MADYLFKGSLDNTVHEITYSQIQELYEDNKREEEEGRRITESSYRGENYYDGINDDKLIMKEYLYRDPKTAGFRIRYPHGTVIEQSMRRNYYRGENQLYAESIPSLLRSLKRYSDSKSKELYRLVADMKISEFKSLLNKFDHVKNWTYCDVLYEALAQHYGLETGWLDITNDFNTALFFATCCWKNGKWEPLNQEQIDTTNQYGMIFHMPSNQMSIRWAYSVSDFSQWTGEVIGQNENGENILKPKEKPSVVIKKNLIYPLGFQPFMRCHMQSGYGIYMRESFSLQEDTGFEKLKFRQSAKLSQKVFDLMEGGLKIYPHEGLNQAQFIIDEIRNLTCFSEEAFNEALYKNHYYRIEDKEKCLEDLNNFELNGKKIIISTNPPWHISPVRRQRIDAVYKNFSLEKDYGIKIIERYQVPAADGMYEPWMLSSSEDEPGVVDFKIQKKNANVISIMSRNLFERLYTVQYKKHPNF